MYNKILQTTKYKKNCTKISNFAKYGHTDDDSKC